MQWRSHQPVCNVGYDLSRCYLVPTGGSKDEAVARVWIDHERGGTDGPFLACQAPLSGDGEPTHRLYLMEAWSDLGLGGVPPSVAVERASGGDKLVFPVESVDMGTESANLVLPPGIEALFEFEGC